VAAEHLHRLVDGVEGVVGDEGLDHRRQQRHQRAGLLAHGRVGMAQLLIDQQRNPGAEGAAGFGVGHVGHHQNTNIGMHDDRVGGLVRPHRPAGGAHLQAIAGVAERLLVGHFG